jgi:hypothetical protein
MQFVEEPIKLDLKAQREDAIKTALDVEIINRIGGEENAYEIFRDLREALPWLEFSDDDIYEIMRLGSKKQAIPRSISDAMKTNKSINMSTIMGRNMSLMNSSTMPEPPVPPGSGTKPGELPPLGTNSKMTPVELKEDVLPIIGTNSKITPVELKCAVITSVPISKPDFNLTKGIVNIGNSCYMNSALQLLYSIPEFRKTLIEKYDEIINQYGGETKEHKVGNKSKKISHKKIIEDLYNIFKDLQNDDKPKGNICRSLLTNFFKEKEYEDIAVFLTKLLDIVQCNNDLTDFRNIFKYNSSGINESEINKFLFNKLNNYNLLTINYNDENINIKDKIRNRIKEYKSNYVFNEYLIIYINMMGDSKLGKKDKRIKLNNSNEFELQNKKFKLIGCVFHLGDGTHYVYTYRNPYTDDFILIDDDIVNNKITETDFIKYINNYKHGTFNINNQPYLLLYKITDTNTLPTLNSSTNLTPVQNGSLIPLLRPNIKLSEITTPEQAGGQIILQQFTSKGTDTDIEDPKFYTNLEIDNEKNNIMIYTNGANEKFESAQGGINRIITNLFGDKAFNNDNIDSYILLNGEKGFDTTNYSISFDKEENKLKYKLNDESSEIYITYNGSTELLDYYKEIDEHNFVAGSIARTEELDYTMYEDDKKKLKTKLEGNGIQKSRVYHIMGFKLQNDINMFKQDDKDKILKVIYNYYISIIDDVIALSKPKSKSSDIKYYYVYLAEIPGGIYATDSAFDIKITKGEETKSVKIAHYALLQVYNYLNSLSDSDFGNVKKIVLDLPPDLKELATEV